MLSLVLGGCDSTPPADRQAATRPAESASTPDLPPPREPAAQLETKPAAQPETEPPATQPAEPKLPDYLAIINRIEADEAVDVRIVTAADRKLMLETRNVRRLHIDRAQVPVDKDRSIVLVLDGQVLEWRANSKVVEFERTPAGVWIPVKPEKSKGP
ncbi:MAG: hypothetical protein KAY37_05420 [Phycisphaerae bacterium]|nr:hypothetical protein [Phycisphaerae bacterium]